MATIDFHMIDSPLGLRLEGGQTQGYERKNGDL